MLIWDKLSILDILLMILYHHLSQVIWSSNQVQSQLLAVSQAKQPNANAGNLAIFGNVK